MTRHKIKADICHIFLKHQQVTNSDTEVAFISNILRKTTEVTGTGKSLLEALIIAKHGENLLCTEIVLNVKKQFLYTTCSPHVLS